MSAERNERNKNSDKTLKTSGQVLKFTGSMDRAKCGSEQSGEKASAHDAINPAEVQCQDGVCSVLWKPKRPAA